MNDFASLDNDQPLPERLGLATDLTFSDVIGVRPSVEVRPTPVDWVSWIKTIVATAVIVSLAFVVLSRFGPTKRWTEEARQSPEKPATVNSKGPPKRSPGARP
jgi:hypothetical protein